MTWFIKHCINNSNYLHYAYRDLINRQRQGRKICKIVGLTTTLNTHNHAKRSQPH